MEKILVVALPIALILFARLVLKMKLSRSGFMEELTAEKERTDTFFQDLRHEGEWVVQSNIRLQKKPEKGGFVSVLHSVLLKRRGGEDCLRFEVDCISRESSPSFSVDLIQPGDVYTFRKRILGERSLPWGQGWWKEVSVPLPQNELVPLLVSRAPLELKMAAGKA